MARTTAGSRVAIRNTPNSLLFDVSGEYVDLGAVNYNFLRSDSWTISAWIYMANTGFNQEIFARKLSAGTFRGFDFLIQTNNKPTISIVNTGGGANMIRVDSNTAALSRRWNHLVWTYDGSSTAAGNKIYINGSEVSTTTINDNLSDVIDSGANAYIGMRNASNFQFFGNITDMSCHYASGSSAGVLTAQQIADMYYSGIYPATNLYSRYLFSDGSGATLTDSGGSSRNGTITGATWTSTMVPFTARTGAGARTGISVARTVVS